jgi:hypothetical protein
MKENKLIAEFMGWEEIYKDASQLDYKFAKPNEIIYRRNIDDLKYHSSWDWLMPVVKKVISKDYEFRVFEELKLQLWRVDIDAIYKAVVEFIKTKK